MENKKYEKGISMTFPLELTEIKMKHIAKDNRYLCPYEVKELQMQIAEKIESIDLIMKHVSGIQVSIADFYPAYIKEATTIKEEIEIIKNHIWYFSLK